MPAAPHLSVTRIWPHAWPAVLLALAAGCGGDASAPEKVWGRRGVSNGELVKPRAVAIDAKDRLYLVDWTARIQVFDRDGNYLGPTWTTPDYRDGRPSGLGIDRDGNLIVADSHYHCFRTYDREGQPCRNAGCPGIIDRKVQAGRSTFYCPICQK